MKKFLLGVIILVLVASSVYFLQKNTDETVATDYSVAQAVLAGTDFKLDIADTADLRTLGLSGRTSLDEKTGMLFVFDRPDFHGIWMKDMNFDIDIVWLDNEKRVIYIKEGATPDSYPQVFYPREKAGYVVELPSGEVSKQRIQIGDIFEF